MPQKLRTQIKFDLIFKAKFLLITNMFFAFSILMKGITWSRDSHGLFDYESRHLTKKTLKAEKPVIIIRNQNELSLLQYNENESFQHQMTANNQVDFKGLLKIVNHNNTFYLESAAYQHHERDL